MAPALKSLVAANNKFADEGVCREVRSRYLVAGLLVSYSEVVRSSEALNSIVLRHNFPFLACSQFVAISVAEMNIFRLATAYYFKPILGNNILLVQ